MRPVLPSWITSRNDIPRFRYFLAMETTRRRLPPERSRLACSYSQKTVRMAPVLASSASGSSRTSVRRPCSSSRMTSRSSGSNFRVPRSAFRRSATRALVLAEMLCSLRMSGMMRCVRRLNSSASAAMRRRRAVIRARILSILLFSTTPERGWSSARSASRRTQSCWLSSSSLSIVRMLTGRRAAMRALAFSSAVETRMVRSNGSSPRLTARSISTACWMMYSHSRQRRRKMMRVVSIFFARRISSGRVSSGIEPICERYIRMGSSTRLETASSAGGSSSSLRTSSSVASYGVNVSSSRAETLCGLVAEARRSHAGSDVRSPPATLMARSGLGSAAPLFRPRLSRATRLRYSISSMNSMSWLSMSTSSSSSRCGWTISSGRVLFSSS